MDFDIDYIKKQFCNYKCENKPQINDFTRCQNCDVQNICDKLDIRCSQFMNTELCDVCPINDFIRELKDYKIV